VGYEGSRLVGRLSVGHPVQMLLYQTVYRIVAERFRDNEVVLTFLEVYFLE